MSASPVPQVTKNPDGTNVTVQVVPGYGSSPSGNGTDNSHVDARPTVKMSGVKIIPPAGRGTSGKSAGAR